MLKAARLAIFYAAAFAACGYAARRGGGPERATAGLIGLAVVATLCVPVLDLQRVALPLLAIDALTLAGFVGIAVLADRYWPLYVAAVQLLTVALHGVRAYDPAVIPYLYARLEGESSYLILALLVVGTRRHVRRGQEAGWAWQVRHDGSHAAGDQR